MKVRVKQAFNDWQANVRRHENEIFEMTDERFNALSHNFKSDETQAQGDETTPYD